MRSLINEIEASASSAELAWEPIMHDGYLIAAESFGTIQTEAGPARVHHVQYLETNEGFLP